MATEPTMNGGSSMESHSLTAAERLQQKHEADAAHRPMIEDVVDEEDFAHPPPSMHLPPILDSTHDQAEQTQPMSEKAAGKQKARDESPQIPSKSKPNGVASFDAQDQEAFPALGSGPKAPAPVPAAMAWGAQKPSSVHAGANGTNGHAPLSNMSSSRASTPTSGLVTPASTNASRGSQTRGLSMPQQMPIPGRHSERIQFAPSQLLPRDQLKKPLHDVLRSINKSSKAKVEMKSGPNGNIIFEGTGPVDAARQALKDLAREVGSKQHVKIPIPLSVRPHVIGRQGTVVQGISKRTGARVQIPKAEDTPNLELEDDDSLTIDVAIEGDAVAAEMARREIEAIINERTATVNLRLRDIPAEYYPFIAGPHNSGVTALEDGRHVRVQVPQYHTWSNQPPPQAPSSGMPIFLPSSDNHIRISGDRLAAQEARAIIERQVQELRRQITLSQFPIERGRHQFISDTKGASLNDILAETGCAVILPPASEDTELLTVIGPQDKLELGTNKVIDLASSMQMSLVDIARQHANAPMGPQAHARALTRYLQQRQAIEQLERQFDARIVLPATENGPTSWEVYHKDGRNGIRARQDITNLIGAHPPTRLRHVEIDPFFHEHIHRQGARRVRDDFGVHLLPPEESSQEPHVVLVYEGPSLSDGGEYQLPRQRPSHNEVAEFEANLRKAQEFILGLIQGQQDISAASVEVPPKYRDKVRKFVHQEQQNLPQTEIPVQVKFGATNGGMTNSQSPMGASVLDHECHLRGPSNAVEVISEKIAAFLETEKQEESERGHVTSFDFPQKYANYLIGKKGDNINKYREEFDVDIQVKDGKVEITGPKAKADAAKSRIIALGKKLEDEATHVLKIKPEYHRDMIGAKGSQVNQLQRRYNVRVQFPRSVSALDDDRSVADDASEPGSTRNRRPNQAPDEVVVRGPRKGADDARDELLNLLQWTLDNSHKSTVSVAQAQLPSLIGQGGREMESVRLSTGAQIDVPGSRESADPDGRVQIHLKGSKKQVEDAKRLLEQRAKIFDSSISRHVDVDKKYHKALIGSGGANIRNIVVEAGGSNDRRDLARTVRFPGQDSGDNTIRIEGNKTVVDKIVAAIEAFAGQRENSTTESIEVAPEKHRMLIGRGGEVRRALESQFNIGLDIPKLSQQGPARSQVKVSGQPADVEKAKAHILDLVKDQEGEAFQVPRKYHQAVSDNGQFFRRLRNDHRVTVDHAGHQPPKRSAAVPRPQLNGGASLPLITDDQDSIDNHSWEVVDSGESAEEGDIPWILHGSPESVAKARAMLEKAVEQAKSQQSQSIGYLVLPDPKTHRFIIGQGGSQINAIRKETGCRITVPRDQSQGSAIEIVGSKDGVEQARDIILDVVQSGGRRD
ncbi:MAG: hypothetical protein ASARMPRED_004872 [Alectoria sarmentosa]|nr:MAG: hypothetical protein ASARMPRED_004872 [Alectoria sarmentosa]